ncbi:MAG: ATP-binding protein [Caldilineaceae bacterium]|nr:ATP-binding protein [Caldilineaceae bacterium]
MIKRDLAQYLKSAFQQHPIVTVTGPRQSGKTTLCRATFPDLKYVNLEALDEREFAETDPRGFLARLDGGAIIDEVQHVPGLLSYIQVVVDAKGANSLFILTGSAQFELSRRIKQSLAGRKAAFHLLPLSLTERQQTGAGDAVDDILYAGFYPRIVGQNLNPTQELADYVDTYVERDARQFAGIHNLIDFRRFVRLCAGRVGQLVNYNSLADDAGVSRTTVRAWLSILEESYIVFRLPPYFANIRKRLIKSPKLYFYDVGLAAYLIGIESADQIATHPLRGPLFENTVVAEAAKHRYNRRKRADNLYFYRDVKQLECDLLYPTGQDIAAFEVKSGATISVDYFKSLHRVAELVPNVTSKFVVYGGTEVQSRSDSKVVPLAILGGTLARLEESRETAAFVGRNKGPAPDEADVGALDLTFTRSIRPVLDALDTELDQISELFRRVVSISYVSMDGGESNSSELLKAHYWPQTKTGIVADGFKLSSTRSLGIRHTYTFETYTGGTARGFSVAFSVLWRLDGAKLTQSATIDLGPIPELETRVDYPQLGNRTVDVDLTAAVVVRRIRQRIGELSSGSGGEP